MKRSNRLIHGGLILLSSGALLFAAPSSAFSQTQMQTPGQSMPAPDRDDAVTRHAKAGVPSAGIGGENHRSQADS